MKNILVILLINFGFSSQILSQVEGDSIAIQEFENLFEKYRKLQSNRDFASSEKVLLKADSIAFTIKDSERLRLRCRFSLGRTYYFLNNRDKAIEYITWATKESADLFCKTKQENFLNYFISCHYYLEQMLLSDYAFEEFSKIEEVIKSDSTLNNNCELVTNFYYYYTMCYWDIGDYEKALPINDKLLANSEKCYSDTLDTNAYYHMMKAVTLRHLDQLKSSEAYYRKSKELYEKIPGGTLSRYYVTNLKNLAIFYEDRELLTSTKNYTLTYLQHISHKDKVNYYDIIETNTSLAENYKYLGRLDSALYYIDNAKKIKQTKIKELIYRYDEMLHGTYADIYFKLNEYDKVHQQLDSNLIIFNIQNTPYNYPLADHHLLRGNTFLNEMKYDESNYVFSINQHKCDSIFGKTIYYYNNALGQARAQYYMKNYVTADGLFHQYTEYYMKKIRDASFFLSEVELEGYSRKFDNLFDYLFSMAEHISFGDKVVHAYDAWLFRQGFILNSIREVKTMVNTDPQLKEKYMLLVQNQADLSKELSKPQKMQLKLDSLIHTKNYAEKELAVYSEVVGKAMKQLKHSDILDLLKKDEILLEFVNFRRKFDPQNDYNQNGLFIIDPVSKDVRFLSLFGGEELDSLLLRVVGSYAINEIYGNGILGDLIWSKVLPFLKGKKKVFCTVNGNLSKINIAYLKTSSGKYINEMFDIIYLDSSKDLYKIKNKTTSPSYASAIILGDVDYMNSAGDTQGAYVSNTLSGLDFYDFYMTDPKNRYSKWKSLKYSKPEIESIFTKLKNVGCKVNRLTGLKANEGYLKNNYNALNFNLSPQLLHFSTHAYFFPQTRKNQEIANIGNTTFNRMGDFSLIQSGIVLSGVNKNFAQTDSTFYDDGILTAFEISQLNLQNTKLVVLSACDTGLGEISNSEGVYGLRRAFKIAGVDKIVMSLWTVADYQTMELMTLFYTNLCEGNMDPRKALYEAQKTMRLKKYEPYYWAGFVIVE